MNRFGRFQNSLLNRDVYKTKRPTRARKHLCCLCFLHPRSLIWNRSFQMQDFLLPRCHFSSSMVNFEEKISVLHLLMSQVTSKVSPEYLLRNSWSVGPVLAHNKSSLKVYTSFSYIIIDCRHLEKLSLSKHLSRKKKRSGWKQLYRLESRWRNSHVLVYHVPY